MDPSREKLLQLIDQYRHSRLSRSPDDEFVRELLDVAELIEDLERELSQAYRDHDFAEEGSIRLRSHLDALEANKDDHGVMLGILARLKLKGR